MLNEVCTSIDKFIFGGKADFCIVQDPDVKFKFFIKRGKAKNFYFISGSKDVRKSKLEYLGYVRVSNSGTLTYSESKGISDDGKYLAKGLLWVLNNLNRLPNRVHIVHNGKCSVCGRPLTDSISVARGIGPTCFDKVMK